MINPERREGRPGSEGGAPSKINLAVADESILGDLDAVTEYLSVQRAHDRGVRAELVLVRLVPVSRVPAGATSGAALVEAMVA